MVSKTIAERRVGSSPTIPTKKYSGGIKMQAISSFTVNHLLMNRGIFVSRVDTPIPGVYLTTFDIRLTLPNREAHIPPEASHTIEHLVATYVRNNIEWKDKIVYFGPMGCLTGFYLIVHDRHPVTSEEICPLVLNAFKFVVRFRGEVIGATKEGCGSYLFHNLPIAKKYAKKFVHYIYFNRNHKDMIFCYPTSNLKEK